ncbi:uncharacterized protein F4812DRAFT_243962 [Daldinia caldariorum]|uniref:uncharacterized protein n=1 Tax=Daldinia caldariorum TaxID=326644 RepID=UPI0020085D44|nr:uncharacterized protein F4812DRAFT_243962 [Daldinia caldariorum]KAI1463574.1 hypothetical protein F4812DRAFT_243962 [Daldinia caldariorum]
MDPYVLRTSEDKVEQTKSDFRGSCVKSPNEENIKLLLSEEWCTNDIGIKLLSQDPHAYTYLITKPDPNKLTKTIIRVMLPVDPYFKTQAEVSSLEWVRQYTSLPVPKVVIFDPTGTTQIGLEWIVLECSQGQVPPMAEAEVGEANWEMVSDEKKRSLIRQLVAFYSATFDHQLSTIGSLYMGHATGRRDRDDKVGVIVSPEFYMDNQKVNIGRGPFRNSAEWLQIRIEMKQRDSLAISNTDVALKTKHIIDRLKRLRGRLFDSILFEPTVLTNCDINYNSILMNRNKLVGILGWEHTSALPLWKGCELPKFLQGVARNQQPEERYYLDEHGQWLAGAEEDFAKHMLQWERTSLQKMFLNEMSQACPQWTTIYNSPITRLRKDYDIAVSFCDNASTQASIERWLYTVESGLENIRLQDPGKNRVDISSLGFTIRSLQDRIYDSTNVSDTARQPVTGPESYILHMFR